MDILYDKFGKVIEKGHIIFCEHEPGDDFYLIQSGVVKITKVVKGKERILDILGEGDIFGEMSLLEDVPRSATATADTEVKVLNFNRQNFEGLLKANPAIAVKLLKIFSKRIYEAKRRLEILSLTDSDAKIVDTLLMLAEQKGISDSEDVNIVEIETDQEQVSRWCAVKLEEGSKILKHYADMGKIEIRGGKILLKSVTELSRFVYNKRKLQSEELR